MDDLLLEYSTPEIQKRNLTPITSTKSRQVTRNSNRSRLFSPCTTATPKYTERKSRGEVLFSFGFASSSKDAPWDCFSKKFVDKKFEIKFSDFNNVLKSPYNYMYQVPYDIMMTLSNNLDLLAQIYMDSIEDEDFEWSRVDAVQNDEPIHVYGMITCPNEFNRLELSSVMLQGSWANSAGNSIPLDMSSIPSFSIFPGQFIALQGVNPSGKQFIAQKILPLPLPLPQSPQTCVEFSLMCAAGPFTTNDNLDFQPLQDLIDMVAEKRPDFLILIGPFVPVKHPLIEKNLVSFAHDKIFDVLINRYVIEPLKEIPTKVVLISSSKDIFHQPIYPTPPHFCRKFDVEKVTVLSDPSVIELNGISFGLTSTDILFHLSKEEISNADGNRMTRLLNHLMTQRRFYPLYPPNEDLNVDFVQADAYCSFDRLPLVLITPSNLRQFSQEVNSVCCLNPGYLCKSESGGTYARLKINTKCVNFSNKCQISDYIGAEIVRV
uniref:DNA polymerase alpha subunit B n=1 Tax=Romanomermis culicivorax TaxID=13658 RepID=A0A915HT71_ROMCU